jgi:5-methylcytosine-specific restriction endonuclease McrA
VTSASGQGGVISYAKVQETFEALEKIGAIRKQGDPTRDGTLYRVMLPEELEICQVERQRVLAPSTRLQAGESEVDYYNYRENRLKIYERDGYKCKYCNKQLTRFTATLDHVTAVSQGGDNSFENLITSCRECNSKKNARLLGDFMADMNPSQIPGLRSDFNG